MARKRGQAITMTKSLDSEDLKFLKKTANEINGLLTEMSGYLNVLQNVVRESGEEARLMPMMTDTLTRASDLAESIQQHIYRKEGHTEALDFLKTDEATTPLPASKSGSENSKTPAKKAGPVRIQPVKNTGNSSSPQTTAASTAPEDTQETPPSTSTPDAAEKTSVRNFGILDSEREEPDTAPEKENPRKFEATGHKMPSSRNIDSCLVGNQETILVVDDEKNILLLVEMMLRSANYKMLKAHDGEEALAIFADRAEEIDLVILDFSMNGMDGQELFERMRELKPEARILVSSGYAEADALKEMLAKGLKGYIPKPYSRDRLLFQIKTAISEK